MQWQEGGKKKSKYIASNDVDSLKAQIEKRRKLEKELKASNIGKKRSFPSANAVYNFKSNIKTGDILNRFIAGILNLRKRDCFDKIIEYINADIMNRVLVLYGLRRTGKTTLIRQAIAEMDEDKRNKTAFIQITSKDTMASLNYDLKFLESSGYKYIFIDEVTLMDDFIEGAALFSDLYVADGMKIVLSGTDSLGFVFAQDDQLYDRCTFIHTTFIPYREFERVLGISGIDEYIRFGGTMSLSGANYNDNSIFANAKTTGEYVDSAIANNIQHSLKFYQREGHFRALRDLYEKGELTSAINRVIEDMNHLLP